ncbi:hypothetical protein L2E82_10513 [Cichorium intybus]|uniref:Uncharacterized protein n=1 Tax=Cichorium intybus TaxID=13427 RepID=A0ACB9GBD6_CICIN|nr:hypothetical protein L2E82_10513 [Cichorium intybus]
MKAERVSCELNCSDLHQRLRCTDEGGTAVEGTLPLFDGKEVVPKTGGKSNADDKVEEIDPATKRKKQIQRRGGRIRFDNEKEEATPATRRKKQLWQ